MKAVPWLVADGYVAAHHEVLNALPLVFVTSNWVKETYIRDGVQWGQYRGTPRGLRHGPFAPRSRDIRRSDRSVKHLGVSDDQIMVLTVGGDATSKGAQEVMEALAIIDPAVPSWKYICKVWPQPRTMQQNSDRPSTGFSIEYRQKGFLLYQCGFAQFHALFAGRL